MKNFRIDRAIYFTLVFVVYNLFASSSLANTARAVEQIEIQNPEAIYTFGQSVTFSGTYTGEGAIAGATVFWQIVGEERARQATASIRGGDIAYSHQINRSPIRPFSTVSYWFGIKFDNGDFAISETFSFEYTDNRFEWQSRQTREFSIYWAEGDLGFAQQALDAARASVQQAQNYLPVAATRLEGIRIYIYPSAAGLQSALQLAGFEWVAGHADPKLDTVLISIPAGPSQGQELERQIPHELMHLMVYQYLEQTDGSYRMIPVWLNEGLASSLEMSSSTDYAMALIEAYNENRFFPMQSLCISFPTGAREVIQAYAQSTAFVRYLHQQFGATGLQTLLQNYGDGLECERGIEVALGIGLGQLEQNWLADTFGAADTTAPVTQPELSPWFLLLLLILGIPALLGLSMVRARRPVVNR